MVKSNQYQFKPVVLNLFEDGEHFDYMKNLRNTKINDPKKKQIKYIPRRNKY